MGTELSGFERHARRERGAAGLAYQRAVRAEVLNADRLRSLVQRVRGAAKLAKDLKRSLSSTSRFLEREARALEQLTDGPKARSSRQPRRSLLSHDLEAEISLVKRTVAAYDGHERWIDRTRSKDLLRLLSAVPRGKGPFAIASRGAMLEDFLERWPEFTLAFPVDSNAAAADQQLIVLARTFNRMGRGRPRGKQRSFYPTLHSALVACGLARGNKSRTKKTWEVVVRAVKKA